MKLKLATLIVSVFMAATAFSQEKNRELYITNSLQNWNLTSLSFELEYKSQLKDNTYLRLRSGSNYFTTTNISDPNDAAKIVGRNYNIRGGLGIGLEKRKQLSDNIMFFNGLNIYGNYITNFEKFTDPAYTFVDQERRSYYPHVALTYHVGMYINLKERLLLGLTYEPFLYYQRQREYQGTTKTKVSDTFGANISPSNLSIMLGVRWHK